MEGRNFEIRKHLLEYDDVMNKQRAEIYRFRREILEGEDRKEYILGLAEDILIEFLDSYANKETDPEEWDLENLQVNLRRVYGIDLPQDVDQLSRPELEDRAVSSKSNRSTWKRKSRSVRK